MLAYYPYDAASDVLLRADDAAAVTSTATTTPVAFNWGAAQTFSVNIVVSAIDTTDADETYQFTVVSADAAGANAVDIVTLGASTDSGRFIVPIDADTAQKSDRS